jgi:hypothetical protein
LGLTPWPGTGLQPNPPMELGPRSSGLFVEGLQDSPEHQLLSLRRGAEAASRHIVQREVGGEDVTEHSAKPQLSAGSDGSGEACLR